MQPFGSLQTLAVSCPLDNAEISHKWFAKACRGFYTDSEAISWLVLETGHCRKVTEADGIWNECLIQRPLYPEFQGHIFCRRSSGGAGREGFYLTMGEWDDFLRMSSPSKLPYSRRKLPPFWESHDSGERCGWIIRNAAYQGNFDVITAPLDGGVPPAEFLILRLTTGGYVEALRLLIQKSKDSKHTGCTSGFEANRRGPEAWDKEQLSVAFLHLQPAIQLFRYSYCKSKKSWTVFLRLAPMSVFNISRAAEPL